MEPRTGMVSKLGMLLSAVAITLTAAAPGAAAVEHGCSVLGIGPDSATGAASDVFNGTGQTFLVRDSLLRSLTVWRSKYQCSPTFLIGLYPMLMETLVNGEPDVDRIFYEGPTMVIPGGDCVHPIAFRWQFDPPMILPHIGRYAFFVFQDPCGFYVDLAAHKSPGGASYPDGTLWYTGRTYDCHTIPFIGEADSVDLIFEVETCHAWPMFIGEDVRVPEGNAGVHAMEVALRLSSLSDDSVTVRWHTEDSTATAADGDYTPAAGLLAIAPGDSVGYLTVDVNEDRRVEPDEAFKIVLTDPEVAGIVDPVAVVTLANDDQVPSVAVLWPNGGERLEIGRMAELTWQAADNDSVAWVDLYLSRDGGVSYQPLALHEDNDGVFPWLVTGPPAPRAGLIVLATDDGGNETGDSSDDTWTIADPNTAVLLSRFEAEPVSEGIELRWAFADRSTLARLERAEARGGWRKLDVESRISDGVITALDRNVELGRSYQYRLVVESDGGETVYGPITARAGEALTFGLAGITPNPALGRAQIEYTVAREADVRLTVVDLQGRLVAVLAEGRREAGHYRMLWSGEGDRGQVPAGLYFVRYEAGGTTSVRRLLLAR